MGDGSYPHLADVGACYAEEHQRLVRLQAERMEVFLQCL